ncbi:hypothetical protein N7468_005544, partial [Penicillium chermesinum]
LSVGIRRTAFEKLAALAVKSSDDCAGLDRIAQQSGAPCQTDGALDGILKNQAPTSRVPMGIRELDVLLALCKAASSVTELQYADRLIVQLSQYLPESPTQIFRPSPFFQSVQPSPWESLSYNLTSALLSLGTEFPTLREPVLSAVTGYLNNCREAINAVTPFQYSSEGGRRGVVHESIAILSIAVSLAGFLDASAKHTTVWTPGEKLWIIDQLRSMLSESFLIGVETASSTIRNAGGSEASVKDWRKYTRRYAHHGRPLGAMLLQEGFMHFVKSCAASLIGSQHLSDSQLLDEYMAGVGIAKSYDDADIALIERVTDLISEEIHLLEDGADYLQVGSPSQQQLAFAVKRDALIGFLNCVVLGEDAGNNDTLLSWLEETLADPQQMANAELAKAALKCTAILARMSPNGAGVARRSLLKFIAQGGGALNGSIIAVASKCLAHVLNILSEDAVIATLYSLGNALSPGPGADKFNDQSGDVSSPLARYSQGGITSQTSLPTPTEDESLVHRDVVHAIVIIATSCNDDKISALAQSMLLQKVGKLNVLVDAYIIQETAVLAISGGKPEFQLLLKFYTRIFLDGVRKGLTVITDAVECAMAYLAVTLERTSVLHGLYLTHLLESIVNKGDVPDVESERHEILFWSLQVVRRKPHIRSRVTTMLSLSLFRDAWFNIAIHGITLNSSVCQAHEKELRLLASHSPPLVAEERMESLESDVELNTVLRRGMGPQRMLDQKRTLINELPGHDSDIKRLDYPRAVFLNASLLVESLRSSSGDCTKILRYFRDPSLSTAEMVACMNAIAEKTTSYYLTRTLSEKYDEFSAPYLSKQLATFLVACCHRIERVQSIAIICTDKIIRECPSALCEKHSLFALLEILTVMWSSCLQGELDEYEWQPTLLSPMGIVRVDLPDNYVLRKVTLDRFLARARGWVTTVVNIAPLDIKGLLQTYLSEYEDDGGYGHIAMGRSFALEMGSLIPQTDPRLGSIEGYNSNDVNVASDFMALYTTRQKYRRQDMSLSDIPENEFRLTDSPRVELTTNSDSADKLESSLAQLYARSIDGQDITLPEVRSVLRQAAALICNSNKPCLAVVHYLVALPFQIFTKEVIRLGVSLWLGVIHENPNIEPRVLAEVVEAWERSIQRKKGLFDPLFKQPDPFQTVIETQPTDKASMLRTQNKAQEIISPHSRILQFFESHFNAIRLGNLQDQQLFYRLISSTVVALTKTQGHPLAREVHFRIVLFGLNILSYFSPRHCAASWKLKDQVLSAALAWFKHPPKIKAEDKILGNVLSTLRSVSDIAAQSTGAFKSLQPKQELTQLLIENERSRLRVWLFPLDSERKYHLPTLGGKNAAEGITSFLRLAWAESAGLAIQLAARFPSPRMQSDIRRLIMNFPEKAVEEASALDIMFDSCLPSDVNFQLKGEIQMMYLLYWAPVNPTEALTYFMPAYGNHPYILQYAMRALESHSIEVRFYFVPQLVQALRYDALGYVERYIMETAKQSQLFAHQVIWNMKANSYKDEDSQVPDPIKPTLDRFMENLISTFSVEELNFYEREFSFFNEITGISGKLKPYIKKSKPEKKEKIEEELRKIKVEVGVYLPSNPDGVVVGIDRKSGKPLQSHAKAPYMATFRIQKTRPRVESKETRLIGGAHDHQVTKSAEQEHEKYEVWQSAIFKVGDDCRQDMLALQMIAAFQSIFSNIGLDVWVFPYRVTSTAPGCGVIDVLPNSISRDMLGREAVNGLYDYFISKYGGEDSIRFQEARTNFVKSMAAYSVISYLLQFKDRHNGNIMIDDAGHIIHIDFGFCFDIAPGGVRFERAPFKLTSEMVAVISGTHDPAHHPHNSNSQGLSLPGTNSFNPTATQPYKWFESLVVKAFLASRPYASQLSHIVSLMLDSGLPCFKPETLKNFRDRFVLERSERDAAEFMRELTRKSYMSRSTKGYDQFQLMTNGIPY